MLTICYQIKKVCLPVLFLLFSLFSCQCFAQYTYELDKTTRFEKMGAEEGLSSGYGYCMHQDKYGFVWIGTQIGLNLYNGYEVKVFNANPKNSQSLYNNWIISIFEEDDGTMWFCTSIGISKYNRANQTFINYIPDTLDIHNDCNRTERIVQDADYLWVDVLNGLFQFNKETGEFHSYAKDTINPSKGIHGTKADFIFMDGSGVLWVGSSDFGEESVLNRFNKETETFIHYHNVPSFSEGDVEADVVPIIEDHEGTIWIATRGGGLLEVVDKENGRFRQYVHDENDRHSIIDSDLEKVFEDSKGNIWTGGKDGFSKLNKKTGQFINYKIPPYSYDHSKSNYIKDIIEDDKGELWLVAYEGFFRFDPSVKILRHYLNDPENKNSLSSNSVLKIMHDRSGQDWILTYMSGVNKLNHFVNSFQKVEMNSNDENALSSNYITMIFGDSKGNLWLGTNREGLNKTLLKKTRDFTDFELYVADAENPKSIYGNRIFSIYEDKEQTLWIGTYIGTALNRYNEQNNDFTPFLDPRDTTSIQNGIIDVTFEDSHGIFWVGTRNGLNIMDRETGKFLHFSPDINNPGAIASTEVSVIYEDSYGELWFGGSFLEKLNRKDTSFIHYFSDSLVFREFEKSKIWNIVEDNSANLWFSTYNGGLFKFNRKDSTFTTFTTQQGLPSNTITAIEIDSKGFIWASTTQGLSRIDPRNYSIRNYDDADGLVNLEFIEKSSFIDEDGWLYFGGRSGFTFFHPDSIKENKFIPPVYITSLTVAGQQKYFDKPLYEMSTIELRYIENDFSFDFVALNYINSQKNQYAFKLEGYDDEWKNAENRRSAFYTNLSPGKYTFRVKGSNNDGYWNEEGASLVMIIHPPFWKTWWAYTFYVIFTISILYLIFRFYLRRQRLLYNLELKHVQAEQLAELDIEKNKFFSNISHEFRTPLTLILGPLERLISKKKDNEEKDQLNLVKRNARRLQTLINQLLSLSKLESGKMILKARPENIVKLTRLFLQSFHSMAADRGINLAFESDTEEYIVYVDTIKFEKVVNNLLSNAFKFTERGGEIKVKITPLNPPLMGETHRTPPFLKGAGGIQNTTLDHRPTEGETPPFSKGAGGIQIKFSDTGIGISKEDLPHVFDRFYQVDETQMKTNLGTGIGLSLTKELIELHHGTITVESEPVPPPAAAGGLRGAGAGAGTTFTIFLPFGKDHLTEDEIFVRKDSYGEPDNGGSETDDELLNDDYLFLQDAATKTDLKEKVPEDNNLPLVLIVEDNEDMRTYIKSYLIDSYNIIEATNGKEGAEKAIEHIPDLIVSDLMMPELDGNEMTIQLKTDERTSHIPIILLTAKASMESKLEGLETGADDFLTKPFDADELLIRIKNLIEQRRKLSVLLSQHIGDTGQTRLIQESSGKMITGLDEQFIEKATTIVREHMASQELNVEMLAGEMAMSRVQLHRKLKGLTDNSPSDLIRNIRLMKAAELLKEGELNVTQISYEIGYLSLSNFAKTFKEKYGVNPSEYL